MVIWWQVVSKMFAQKIIEIYQSLLKSQSIILRMLFDIFLSISTHILLVLFSPGSAEADIGWGRILNSHLMASCARNNCTKNCYKKFELMLTRCTKAYSSSGFSNLAENLDVHAKLIYKYQILYLDHITIVPWCHLVNDIDLCRSLKLPKNPL